MFIVPEGELQIDFREGAVLARPLPRLAGANHAGNRSFESMRGLFGNRSLESLRPLDLPDPRL